MESNNEVKYAGFFTRLLATLVDIAVVSFVINIVGSAITLNAFIILAIWWLYVSVMIIKWRATIGGKLFGIEVLKSDDLEPLSFKWASVRFFVSIAPFFFVRVFTWNGAYYGYATITHYVAVASINICAFAYDNVFYEKKADDT